MNNEWKQMIKESNVKIKLSHKMLMENYNDQFKNSLKNNKMGGGEKLWFKT